MIIAVNAVKNLKNVVLSQNVKLLNALAAKQQNSN
ncbi:Uncharacterised protein [Enterobacter cloacae]|nr:Uncharacterised protein [Enterobacter cloacae]